ncbi:MAG: RNA polymerase factor sigma-54, partial [Hymenobacteraceae bacterium]|nr:RNA polymerase factor sigma-54 [Hymenobacteraceae bacterium]
MQRLDLRQVLSQKLSPQQIQFIKLLQIPTAELEARIKEELEVNPALEEGREEERDQTSDEYDEYEDREDNREDDLNLDDYINDDEISGYKMQGDRGGDDDDDREMPIAMTSTLTDSLIDQLGFLNLDDRRYLIGMQLIGSIDHDGYIRRDLRAIVNDLAFSQNVMTTEEEVEEILKLVQSFDPPGIAARDLQECLLLQLERREQDKTIRHAERIIKFTFDEFTKKHYSKIQSKLDLSEAEVRDAVNVIVKLNPKPGGAGASMTRIQYIIPDFILTNNNGELQLSLNARNAPALRISHEYSEMFDAYEKSAKTDKKLKETVQFVKQKLDAAKWFIDAIRQRQNTLLRTMEAIIKYQKEFFIEGDESKLKPMILKDIAQEIGMD